MSKARRRPVFSRAKVFAGVFAKRQASKRYLIRDADGKPTETIDELFDRVAGAIAKPDFLPNSPTLMNAGGRWASFRPASCCLLRTAWRTFSRR
jgi:ribonucleotide reductase alpha subunit